MREILFRAKAINRDPAGGYRTHYKNGDWVYGLLSKVYDDRFDDMPAEFTNEDGISGIDVDLNTIGQYTGINDAQGNKIFEGDILKCVSKLDYAYMVVIFEDGEFRLVKCEDYQTYTTGQGYYMVRCFHKEVIGNIFDNKEYIGDDING